MYLRIVSLDTVPAVPMYELWVHSDGKRERRAGCSLRKMRDVRPLMRCRICCGASVGGKCAKKMHVVWPDHQLDDLSVQFGYDRPDQLHEAVADIARQHGTVILRAPHQVVRDLVRRVARMANVHSLIMVQTTASRLVTLWSMRRLPAPASSTDAPFTSGFKAGVPWRFFYGRRGLPGGARRVSARRDARGSSRFAAVQCLSTAVTCQCQPCSTKTWRARLPGIVRARRLTQPCNRHRLPAKSP